MRLGKLDLNLLVTLEALLEERSVSLAAERIHLTQSATSMALGRLRDYFQDELLVLKGRKMALTPRGEELLEPLRSILGQIRVAIAVPQPFDPSKSDRQISIMASDYVVEVLLHTAMLELAEEAPNMRFEISPPGDDLIEGLQRGRVDILVTIDTAISTELPSAPLYEDDFVIVGWSGNRSLKGPLTTELYEQLSHVTVCFGRQRHPSFEAWALKRQAIRRRIEIVAPTFTSVAGFVVYSDRIATMHRRLAVRMSRHLPLKIMEAPFEIPPIRQMAQWTTSSSNDPAIAWLVGRLQEIAAST